MDEIDSGGVLEVARLIIALIVCGLLILLGIWFWSNSHEVGQENLPLIHRDLDYSEVGFDLMAGETVGALKLNLSAGAAVKHLGEPETKTEAVVWGADGLEHQTWIYRKKGIEIDLVRKATGQIINRITLELPCKLKTTRGIGIGSTKKEVIRSYHNEIDAKTNDPNASHLIAGTVYGGIFFNFTGDKVSQIIIGAIAE